LPEEWKESIIVRIYRKDNKTDFSNYSGISLLPTTYKIVIQYPAVNLIPYAEGIIGEHQFGFCTTGHLLIMYSAFVKYLKKNENTTKQRIIFL
jgi:hypothetical protein